METVVKMILWFFVSTTIELIASFVIAAFLIVFFNWSGVAALAGLGYWSLYWIQMAIYESIASAVVMGVSAYELNQS